MSDLVSYHTHNPDPIIGGCRNTGEATDGVVFHGVEPVEGVYTFIGRQSMLEGMSEMYGISVKEIKDRLADDLKPQERLREAEAKVKALEKKLAEHTAFFDALRDQGFVAVGVS